MVSTRLCKSSDYRDDNLHSCSHYTFCALTQHHFWNMMFRQSAKCALSSAHSHILWNVFLQLCHHVGWRFFFGCMCSPFWCVTTQHILTIPPYAGAILECGVRTIFGSSPSNWWWIIFTPSWRRETSWCLRRIFTD